MCLTILGKRAASLISRAAFPPRFSRFPPSLSVFSEAKLFSKFPDVFTPGPDRLAQPYHAAHGVFFPERRAAHLSVHFGHPLISTFASLIEWAGESVFHLEFPYSICHCRFTFPSSYSFWAPKEGGREGASGICPFAFVHPFFDISFLGLSAQGLSSASERGASPPQFCAAPHILQSILGRHL